MTAADDFFWTFQQAQSYYQFALVALQPRQPFTSFLRRETVSTVWPADSAPWVNAETSWAVLPLGRPRPYHSDPQHIG